jgi:hypothetical protein
MMNAFRDSASYYERNFPRNVRTPSKVTPPARDERGNGKLQNPDISMTTPTREGPMLGDLQC